MNATDEPHCKAGTARVAYHRCCKRCSEKDSWFHCGPPQHVDGLGAILRPRLCARLCYAGAICFAVLGVNGQETQGSIDAALTFGILWLDACRMAKAGKFVVEGLKMFVPAGASALPGTHGAFEPEAAKWHLYELEERDDNFKEMDVADCGNVATRLVHSTESLQH